MGHLYRQLVFSGFLAQRGMPSVFFVNKDEVATKILSEHDKRFEIVDLTDYETGWERTVMREYPINVWIDDRLNTDKRHARFIKDHGVTLVVFDDGGTGATLADFNFSALCFEKNTHPPGRHVFTGTDYLILNPEIDAFKRPRHRMDKILVTLGGSDTHGVTSKVVKMLKSAGHRATIVLGPSFKCQRELLETANDGFKIKHSVKSLVAEFGGYDLAICGGGITPFEANASGLPCLIIANEPFEASHAQYLESLGSSVFAGYHTDLHGDIFDHLPTSSKLSEMSQAGLSHLDTKGAERIFQTLTA
jgi:spore coat polysaccharide biosynthesis predicted glycosyltransferase SpsG